MIGQAWGACVQDGVATLACICPVYENVVRGLIFFAGIIAVLAILLAGLKYITSGGDSKQAEGARSTLIHAIIGLILILISFGIINLISYITGAEFKLECPLVKSSPAPPTPTSTTRTQNQPPNPRDLIKCMDVAGYGYAEYTLCTIELDCSDSNPLFFSMDEEYINLIGYRTEEALRELEKVLDKPIYVYILAGSVDNRLYFAAGGDDPERKVLRRMLGRALFKDSWSESDPGQLYIAWKAAGELPIIGYGFAKFKKSESPPEEFLEARRTALDIALSKGLNLGLVRGSVVGTVISRARCSDADYYISYSASPLIYVYPRSKTSVEIGITSSIISLRLPLNENKHWNVSAFPNGTLTTLDGKKYRYIPYEFLRYDFQRPERGFVIEGNKLEDYLRNEFWPKLGLTNQEIDDYWNDAKGRVPQSSYYFISLIDRSEIDRVLPMEVNPKPDTILRNMTYILPLASQPTYTPQPLEITAPERKGFTVLENGVFTDGF